MSHSHYLLRKPLIADRPAALPPAGDAVLAQLADRLLCATRYAPLGASSRLRIGQYIPWLQRAGLHTSLRPFLSDAYVAALYGKRSRLPFVAAAYLRAFGTVLAARRHDLIWIEKELLPWLPYWLERWAIGSKPYVLDFDDAWALRYERATSPLVRRVFGHKFTRLVQNAALTITANQTLYDWALAQGATRVALLPTVIDLDHYKVTPEPPPPFTIGWVGTPITAPYLQDIAGPLRQLAAEAPLRLLIIGAPALDIPGVDCVHRNWSEATEASLIATCHAGIMPLPDDAWARGKSGYKLIQYMAAGRPTVASPVGANQQIVLEGQTGYLASTADEWLTALRKLRDDQPRRQRMGQAARHRVETEFSLQVTAPILIELFKELLAQV